MNLAARFFTLSLFALITALGIPAIILIAFLGYYLTRPVPPSAIEIAVAMPLSGPQKNEGAAVIDSIQLCFDEVNRQGGIKGHPLKLVPYDDKGDPLVAAEKAKEIAASPALAVLGHLTSATSVAAGQIYKANAIPAISASASATSIVTNNPYYFMTAIDTSLQGHFLAVYAKEVLGQRHVRIIYSDEIYGKSLMASFTDEFVENGGTVDSQWMWNPKGNNREHSTLIRAVSADIANGDGGVVLLAISPFSSAKDALTLLRRTGVNPIVLGGITIGNNFPELFADEPEEKQEPGFFTNSTYTQSSIIFDSSSQRALDFSNRFQKRFGIPADDRTAKFYETALVLAEALRRSPVQLTDQSRNDDRQKVRAGLNSLNSEAQAVDGLTGPIYFDERKSANQQVRIGKCTEGHLISAPIQLAPISNPALIDLSGEMSKGNVVRIRQTFYWLQQVVYTGIDINQIDQVNTGNGTFTTDFYLWFRYAGNDAVRDVDFNGLSNETLYDAKNPLLEQQVNGLHYSLYRVQGDFRVMYDFHDYPFDSQSLVIHMTNPRMTREQVIYAIDTFGLELPKIDEGVSQLPQLANWNFSRIRYQSDALGSVSTRGHPKAFHANHETYFSGFNAMAWNFLQRMEGQAASAMTGERSQPR